MPRYRYDCTYCNDSRAELLADQVEDVCANCEGVCSRVSLCETCRTNDAADGIDLCIGCYSDLVVEDPSLLADGFLAKEVSIELARRLRAKLTVRQAA